MIPSFGVEVCSFFIEMLIVECLYYLQRWIDRNNRLKKHYSNIQEKCAEFEYQFVPKLKAVCRAYVALVQNECQIVNEAVLDLDGTLPSQLGMLTFRNFQSSGTRHGLAILYCY